MSEPSYPKEPRKRTRGPSKKYQMLLAMDPFSERSWGLVLSGLAPDPMAAMGYFLLKVLDTQLNDARREMRRSEVTELKVPAIHFWRRTMTGAEIRAVEARGVEIERYDKIADQETFRDLMLLRSAVEINDRFGQFGDDDTTG